MYLFRHRIIPWNNAKAQHFFVLAPNVRRASPFRRTTLFGNISSISSFNYFPNGAYIYRQRGMFFNYRIIPRSFVKSHFVFLCLPTMSAALLRSTRHHVPAQSEWMPRSERAYTAADAPSVTNAREHDAGLVYEVRLNSPAVRSLPGFKKRNFICCSLVYKGRSVACSWSFGGV